MFIPIRTDSPLRSTPYMNWALIVVNVLVWVAQSIGPSHGGGPAGGESPAWYYGYTLSAAQPELLHFLTYGFLHAGALHLAGNMLFLYIFGNNVNDKMGHVGYLAFYLAAVVASGLAYVMTTPGGTVLGASGGVSAVVGAYLILFPRAHVTVLAFFIIIGAFEIPSLWFVAAFFLKDLIGLSGQSDVAHSAHVGGTLFGVAVCMALLGAHLLPRDQFDVLAMIKRWNRRRAYRDAVSSGWNPYGTSPGPGPRGGGGGTGGPVRTGGSAGGWGGDPTVTAATGAPVAVDPRQQQILDLRARISEAVAGHDLPRAVNLYVELKSLDPRQVIPRQSQLDVANQLAAEQRFAQAAEAYETFLLHYPRYEQVEKVELMVGLFQARFLAQPAKAREHLLRALTKLTDDAARGMAKDELAKMDAAGGGGSPGEVRGTPNLGGAG